VIGRGRVIAAGLAAGGLALGLGAYLWQQDPDRQSARAWRALDVHDLAAAEAGFRKAAALDPLHLGALEGLGWTYQVAGQQAAAEAAFQRCVEIDEEALGCHRGLASGQMGKGELGKAREILDRAEAIDPGDPKLQASRGLLELAEGEVDRGAERYEALVARFPDEAEYRVGLAEARLRQRRLEEALAVVDEGLTLRDAPTRTRGLLSLLRARILVASVVGRVEGMRGAADCEESAAALRAWLDAADLAVAEARETGVRLPTLNEVGRLVGRARGSVEDACPPRLAPDGK
jgi:tetratricopeptide (TPR) repeat protein